MQYIFNFFYLIFFVVYLPVLFLKGKWHPDFPFRLGWIPQQLTKIPAQKKRIWIHAVSVGEVMVVAGLIRRLREKHPEHRIVLSTVTVTGQNLAKEKFGDDVVVFYAPLDFSWVVKKMIRLIDPQIYIAAETEIWPNLFMSLQNEKVPIIIINGRISDHSYKSYQWSKVFIAGIVNKVTFFCMQSQLDAQRITNLGADEKKVKVVGNLKFDYDDFGMPLQKEDLGFREDQLIWVAGSTHPGEEKVILEVYQKIIKEYPNLSLILAPRHIERAAEVQRLAEGYYLPAKMYSRILDGEKIKEPVIVVDTIGHLVELYAIATVVFVGKSLVGHGGQNMMEPAFFGKPVIVGPHTENFKDAMALLLRDKAVKQIQDEKQLLDAIIVYLKNPKKMREVGERARQVCVQNQGATESTMTVIEKFLREVS